MSVSKVFRSIPFYPLLLGLYPVIFLWANNVGHVRAYVVPRSLLVSLSFSVIVFLIFGLLVRPLRKAALLAGLLLALFFSYGHVFGVFDNLSLGNLLIGRHRFFLPLWVGLALAGGWLILRTRTDLFHATTILNGGLTALTVFALLQIGIVLLSSEFNSATNKASTQAARPPTTNTGRDVYFILLDAYGREDILLAYDLDNRPFLDRLRKLGFIIPACGRSNYTETDYSLASTLNMNYLDGLGFTYPQLVNGNSEITLTPLIRQSLVRQKFAALGYKFVSYQSPFIPIDIPGSDVYLDWESATSPGQKLETLNFQQLFIRTTLARVLSEWLEKNPAAGKTLPVAVVWLVSPGSINSDRSAFAGRNYREYKRSLFQLDSLTLLPDLPGKKFVFAHVLVTHMPFVFLPNGEFRTDAQDNSSAYHDQVLYMNSRLLEIVQAILRKSVAPPVIILQSDHSLADGGKRVRNFQAYYLPDSPGAAIAADFTNVNTFRVVLNTYFGEKYPLLPNRSYLLGKKLPGGAVEVAPSCPGSN